LKLFFGLAGKTNDNISANFNFPVAFEDATEMAISIEPNGDSNATPGNTMVVKGSVEHSDDIFDLDFATGFISSNARAYVTATGTSNNILNIDFPNLPNIQTIGWVYEAWYVIENEDTGRDMNSTAGTFHGSGGRMLFKRGALPVDLLTVNSVMVSIEPNPDDSDAVSGIIPWSGDVPTTTTSPTDTTDEDLYEGLTTSMTSKSIRDRTEMEVDENDKVIVQAYAGSPDLADGEKQAIVVKVSNLDGEPIGDLDLELSRIQGPSGNLSDPQEIGNMTGVYVGTYDADDDIGTSGTVILRVQGDSSEDLDIPPVEVSFEASSSEQLGSPRRMEIDVTREKLVIDENDSDLQNAEMAVIAGVQDSSDRGITDVLGSQLSLISNSDVLSGTVKGNVKTWKLDDNFFDVDGEDEDITVSQDFVLQLIPGSGDGWSPMISTEYEVECEFIANT